MIDEAVRQRIAERHPDIPQDELELGVPARPHGRRCAWCKGPMPARARVDAVCCSQSCRQARHRASRRPACPVCNSLGPCACVVVTLEVTQTLAMAAGGQSVYQCASCGTVVVQPRPASAALGPCPVCASASWWLQTFPVAGARPVARGSRRARVRPGEREIQPGESPVSP